MWLRISLDVLSHDSLLGRLVYQTQKLCLRGKLCSKEHRRNMHTIPNTLPPQSGRSPKHPPHLGRHNIRDRNHSRPVPPCSSPLSIIIILQRQSPEKTPPHTLDLPIPPHLLHLLSPESDLLIRLRPAPDLPPLLRLLHSLPLKYQRSPDAHAVQLTRYSILHPLRHAR